MTTLHRILDNLPVAIAKMRKDDRDNSLIKMYERGYPVGFKATVEVCEGMLACAPAWLL
jgi:transmembrane 9 superfamily member 2/4